MHTTNKSITNIDGLKKVKPGASITFNGDDRISKFANLNGRFRRKIKDTIWKHSKVKPAIRVKFRVHTTSEQTAYINAAHTYVIKSGPVNNQAVN